MGYSYIAGPLYGSGHQDDNIRSVLEVAAIVKMYGHTPFVPHLYFFWNLTYQKPREFWLDLDKEWLRKCDNMLRLQGDSPGSSLEEGWCTEFEIPWCSILYVRGEHEPGQLTSIVYQGLVELGAEAERLV